MHTHSDPFEALDSDLSDESTGTKPTSYRGKFSDAQAALRYTTAGRATITLQSKRTGARFTYRISHPKTRDTGEIDKSTLMISVLVGQDNESSYKWFANIKSSDYGQRLWIGRKNPKPGDLSNDAPSVVAFKWVWEKLQAGVLHEQLDVWHEETCGRCGRKLTVPTSIESGFGPECREHVGL